MKKRIAAVCAASAIALAGFAGPASAAGPPPPPNCESGQLRAAANAFEKGKFDQAAKHAAKAAACGLGEDPVKAGAEPSKRQDTRRGERAPRRGRPSSL